MDRLPPDYGIASMEWSWISRSKLFTLFLHPEPPLGGSKANLAQLVEHFIRNERVVGSIPIVGSQTLMIGLSGPGPVVRFEAEIVL